MRRTYNLSEAAEQDFRKILSTSLKMFGIDASVRYKNLILQALQNLANNPKQQQARLYRVWHTPLSFKA